MRRLLIASALGLGFMAAAQSGPAEAAPLNAAPAAVTQVEWGAGVTQVQYYRHGYGRPYYGPPPRYYGPPPRYYGPPRRYGYYAPPPPPRYYRHAPRPYYGWR